MFVFVFIRRFLHLKTFVSIFSLKASMSIIKQLAGFIYKAVAQVSGQLRNNCTFHMLHVNKVVGISDPVQSMYGMQEPMNSPRKQGMHYTVLVVEISSGHSLHAYF